MYKERYHTVKPCLFGLLWKVVLIANGYELKTMSYHLDILKAVRMSKFYDKQI